MLFSTINQKSKLLKKHVAQHRQNDHGPTKLPPAPKPKAIRSMRVAAKRQRDLMAIIADRENADILSAEWLDEDDVDLSDITVPQDDGNDKSVTMPIITIEEHLASAWEEDSS